MLIIGAHCSEFIAWNGHTMGLFMDESIGTCHGKIRHMERTHNYVCKRKTAGKEKARRSLGSMRLWNFKNLNLMKVKATRKTKRYF